MFSWVCSRCGHEVPPSKTECPFCAPPAPEAAAPQTTFTPPQQQYPAPPPYQQAPPQYAQQPPQYWQPPQGAPPQYPPQPYPPQYPQQAPPQYWQQPQYPPQQYPPPQQYQPVQEQAPPQYQPSPPQPETPPPPPPQQYQPPAPPPQYQPAPSPPATTTTPWPPEEQTGKPAWMVGLLAFAGVLALLGLVYFVVGSHSSSAAKDAAKQLTTNPLQKYIEVVGMRIVGGKSGEEVKFLVVNHGGVELTGLTASVTLYASTQRSEEDSVGTFAFKIDSLNPNDSKELTAPLKTDKGPAEMPDDWRNITADVQVSSAQ